MCGGFVCVFVCVFTVEARKMAYFLFGPRDIWYSEENIRLT